MSLEQELFGTVGVDTGTGQNPVSQESTSQPGTDRQAGQEQTGQPAKINLQELPEFKEYQKSFDSRYEALRQQSLREKQELAQRLSQHEQQLEQLTTRDLDDVGKAQYEINKLRRQNELLLRQQAELDGRQRIFNRISQASQKVGVTAPVDLLADAQDADDAWERAYLALANSLPKQAAALAEARIERREANSVDIGGGAPSGVGAELQQRYERALAQNNVSLALDVMNEADIKNVKLRF